MLKNKPEKISNLQKKKGCFSTLEKLNTARTANVCQEIKILAMCACYNRREVTIAGLRSLHSQLLPVNATLQLLVVDDNSEDCTLEAVRQEFPEALTLKSTGGLYWAGAMRLGFSSFWNSEIYTHLLVFNDDCIFYPNALDTLIRTCQFKETAKLCNFGRGVVVVGSFRDGYTGELTYGGLVRKIGLRPITLNKVTPTLTPQYVDTMNMNLALIDSTCLCDHNLFDSCFTHSYADFDFGLRVSSHGIPIIVAPNYQGVCSRNTVVNTWQDPTLTFSQRLSSMLGPKGLPLRPRYHFLRRHSPGTWAIFLFWPYVKFAVGHLFSRILGMLNYIKR